MRELGALVLRTLLETIRGRAGRRQLLLLVLAVGLPAFLLGGAGTSGLWAATALLGAALLSMGAGGGRHLPADRDGGREAWLATVAPPAALRRLAPALATMGLVFAAAVVGALLLALALTGRAPSVRQAAPLESFAGRTPFERETSLVLANRPRDASTLELEILRKDALTLPLEIAWSAEGPETKIRRTPGPVRLEVPAGARSLRLVNRTNGTGLVLREARWLGGERSFVASVLFAALALALVAAALAPVSVFVSRFTSAPTAVAAGFVLGLLAIARPWLLGLVPPEAPPTQALALRALDAFARLAPDAGTAALASELPAGRAVLPSDVLAAPGLPALLLYAFVALMLVALPAPRALEREARS